MIAEIDNNKIPAEVMTVLEKLQKSGHQSYLVGGCVRDLVLNVQPKDYDICTSALPEEVKSLFNKVVETGIKYGTVTVLKKGRPIEVTTFRRDGDYTDGRRPDKVAFGKSPREDVERRDFTVNGLLYDGEKVIDYINGLEDLQRGVVRAIGEPGQRIAEDALRLMRAVRLSCQLNFNIEKQTMDAIVQSAALIDNIAPERIKDELVRILLSEYAARGIKILVNTGLLDYWIPELKECTKISNKEGRCTVFEHTLKVLDSVPKNITVRLAALLHDVGKAKTFAPSREGRERFTGYHIASAEMTREITRRLKFDNKTIIGVSNIIKEHAFRCDFNKSTSVKEFVIRVGLENIENLINLQLADILCSEPPYDFEYIDNLKERVYHIIKEKEPLFIKDLSINGFDLEELGIEPLDRGVILRRLLKVVLANPEFNTKEMLAEMVFNIKENKS